MVINKKFNTDFASTWEIFGLSTEEKPTIANGGTPVPDKTIFVELDTAEGYFYDKDADTWNSIG